MTNAESSSSTSVHPKVRDDDVYKEGDMTIISSDPEPVRFRLSSFYLLAASTVIRDMYRPGSAEPFEIIMTDSEMETADSVRLWLDMITSKPKQGTFELVASQIMALARKYDCAQIASLIVASLSDILDKSSTQIFRIIAFAARFDHPDLLAKAIRYHGDTKFSTGKAKSTTYLGTKPDASCFQPSAWSLKEWYNVPIDYIWALSRIDVAGGNLRARSEDFEALMGAVKGSDISKKRRRED